MADESINIRIRTVADLDAAKRAKTALEGATKSAKDNLSTLKKKREAEVAGGNATDATTQEITEQEAALARLDQQLNEVNSELDSGTAKQLAAASASDKATAAVKKVGDEKEEAGKKTGKWSASLDELKNKFPMVGKAIGALKNPIVLAVAALVAMLKAIKEIGSAAIKHFGEAEEALTKMDAALSNSGQFTQEYRDELIALSSTMQAMTAIGDDVWQSVFARLTQFGATRENMSSMTEATKNLAGALAGSDGDPSSSLIQAATLVGKVMQGNTGALSEYGITVDQTKSKAEQINEVLTKIAQVGGGQMEIRSRTLTARMRELRNVSGDFFEALGRLGDKLVNFSGIVDNVSMIVGFWADVIDTSRDSVLEFAETLPKAVLNMAQMKEVGEEVTRVQEEMSDAHRQTADAINEEIAALQERQNVMDRQEDLQLAFDLQRLEHMDLTEPQRIVAERALRSRSNERRFQREQEGRQEEVNILQDADTQRNQEVSGAEEEFKKAKKLKEIVQEKISTENQIAVNQRRIDDASEQLGAVSSVSGGIGGRGHQVPALQGEARRQQQQRLAYARRQQAKQRKRLEELDEEAGEFGGAENLPDLQTAVTRESTAKARLEAAQKVDEERDAAEMPRQRELNREITTETGLRRLERRNEAFDAVSGAANAMLEDSGNISELPDVFQQLARRFRSLTPELANMQQMMRAMDLEVRNLRESNTDLRQQVMSGRTGR